MPRNYMQIFICPLRPLNFTTCFARMRKSESVKLTAASSGPESMANPPKQEITGKVIRRSTNYVVLEDNNSNLHKCWIWNCIPQTNIDETKLHEINLNVDYGFEAVSETEVKMQEEKNNGKQISERDKIPQDKDVAKKDGTQPKKYYKDMSKGTKSKRLESPDMMPSSARIATSKHA